MNAPLIEFSESAINELSTNQKYHLTVTNAVILGKDKLNQDQLWYLQRSSRGIIHHARWLTTANRLLRSYMSMETKEEIWKS